MTRHGVAFDKIILMEIINEICDGTLYKNDVWIPVFKLYKRADFVWKLKFCMDEYNQVMRSKGVNTSICDYWIDG